MPKEESEIEIDMDVLPDGTIRFTRTDSDRNFCILEIVKGIADPEKTEEIKRFFNGSNSIEQLLGNEPLCG